LNELVVDASVIVKWFRHQHESYLAEALRLREQMRGGLVVVVPTLIFLEVLNSAARRWGWSASELRDLVQELVAMPFVVAEPSLEAVARWASRGLSAYDASYVALAEQRRATLVTTDEQVIAVAPGIARHLRDYA
jgi:predicted nucleic acid-binding protein